ncbi:MULTISPECIES: radical SAM protein [unclassified Oleiphilus]|nr:MULTISPECIES: radical SAM protein [unclassified Oleiphilus]KZY46264.1 radical SAM protein [Oleiphilus sp. HI0050]KZY76035.1 radical SAM protein [Oleiphilus sp. HI0068]KZY77011.1 radical SAM protein [Oleiphilus sp. HI0069]KZZ10000.1 radical SAM protein [Oleiphilus sp. HI0078]KZZ37886.1 radical SAM protein [Oleiphilus sp. HI0085]
MNYLPINYIEPVFRPPSEAKSLILQVTNGCSYNKCTFCDMYTAEQKKFKPKKIEEIEQEVSAVAKSMPNVGRFFLADGDAMTLSFRRLKEILECINRYFPDKERVTAYCLPRNIKKKTVEELAELRALGLSMVYVGCESGDDKVLECVVKGETYESSKDALLKLKAAGIKSSVMILNGLGGKKFSKQHAVNSAKLMNETQPEFVSTLVVSFPMGEERFRAGFNGDYEPLEQLDLFHEIRTLIANFELENTVFRSDHASNYLVLKGNLGADKQAMLSKIDLALNKPGAIPLRQEWQRGL